jgi:hypothetical protein
VDKKDIGISLRDGILALTGENLLSTLPVRNLGYKFEKDIDARLELVLRHSDVGPCR